MSEDDSRARGRATPWLVGAAVVAVAVGTTYALARRPQPSPAAPACPAAPDLPWKDTSGWLKDWTRTAAGARAIVLRDVEAWGTRWTTARTEACALPEADRDAALRCLDRQHGQARALSDALEALDESGQASAFLAGQQLPPPDDCGARRPSHGAPLDPQAQARLDRARALLAVGDAPHAAEAASAVDLSEDDPLRALQRWLMGHGQPRDEAYATWQRALGDAIATDAPRLAVAIALDLATSAPMSESLPAAQRWWALASAHSRRLPTVASRQSALLLAQARMLARHGEHEAAVAVFEPALALLESDLGGTHPALVPGLRDAAVEAAALGKLDAAERLAARALELADEGLGARHPQALTTLLAIAGALRNAEAPEKATAWLRLATERQPEERRGQTLVALGEAYLEAGNHGDASEAFARAHTWSSQHDDALALSIALGRAAVAQARGDAQTASEHLDAVLSAPLRPDERNAVRLRQVAILLDADRLAQAREAATEALLATESEQASDAARGEALTVAADVALRTDRPADAIALARNAVAHLVRAHGPDHPSVLVALVHLGSACLAERRNDEAAAAFSRAARLAHDAASEVRVAAVLGQATALWRTAAKDEATTLVRALHEAVAHDARPGAAADAAAWLAQRGLPLAAAPSP